MRAESLIQYGSPVRLALWGGGEGRLLGSRAYARTLRGPATMKPTAGAKVAGYWNIDNGTGKIHAAFAE
jgi:hypothetical protein